MATNRPKPNTSRAAKRKRPTRIDAVLRLLHRDNGASIAELRESDRMAAAQRPSGTDRASKAEHPNRPLEGRGGNDPLCREG